jgi:hypothetical protein
VHARELGGRAEPDYQLRAISLDRDAESAIELIPYSRAAWVGIENYTLNLDPSVEQERDQAATVVVVCVTDYYQVDRSYAKPLQRTLDHGSDRDVDQSASAIVYESRTVALPDVENDALGLAIH